MVERILLPVDDSPRSNAAVEYALSVDPDASFVLLHVVDPRDWISTDEHGEVYYAAETKDAVVEEADDLAAVREQVAAADRPVETSAPSASRPRRSSPTRGRTTSTRASWEATGGRGSTVSSSAVSRRRWSGARSCR